MITLSTAETRFKLHDEAINRACRRPCQTILLVDDDSDYRRVLRIYLEQPTRLLMEATNGLEALAIATQLDPDIVILDIVMPHANGLETIAKLRRQCPHTKIVAVSGDVRSALYLKVAEHLGANAVFEKNLSIPALIQAIDDWESGSGA